MIWQTSRALVPKKGNLASECEDAIGCNSELGRFAVADGATEGFDSKRWARRLVKLWCLFDGPALDVDATAALVRRLGERHSRRWTEAEMPWYLAEKFQAGSFAAFVGLTLSNDRGGCGWSATALGDSCVFQERAGQLVRGIPLDDPAAFGMRPLLVPSQVPLFEHGVPTGITTSSGKAEKGDVFLLLSDAIACWYLTSLEADPSLAARIHESIADQHAFAQLIDAEREAGRLRNDDVAALRIVVT